MNPSLQIPDEGMTLEELSDFVGMQMKRLNLVLKSLDGLNIVDIKFELQGGAYIQLNRKGLRFNDGTQDTLLTDIDGNVTLKGVINALGGTIGGFTIDLTKLSGDGIIEGGIIRTKGDSEYPRIELSSIGNLLTAYKTATDLLAINPNPTGSPNIIFDNGVAAGIIGNAPTRFWLQGILGILQISANDDIHIFSLGGVVQFNSWSNIYSNGNTETLQQALDAKPQYQVGSGTTGTESLHSSGYYYATLVITYSGFTSIPRIVANNTSTLAAWVSCVTPITATTATIYVISNVTGYVSGVDIVWEAIGP